MSNTKPNDVLRTLLVVALMLAAIGSLARAQERPNILWLTSEDNGPHLGCYGDEFATTPNLDKLAAKGLLYLNCWSTAPVCAPARTTIISGLYPPSTGAEHMRSMTRLPDQFRMYPQYLRAAGYYCTNNSKEDYNLEKPSQVWDDSSRKAHWKNRKPNQPFFAIFNYTVSHESRIRKRPHTPVHSAAKVRVPAYHPDTPEVRRDWAQYYDKVTEMDQQVGRALRELDQAGLAANTIVFYYGDHGSGMPRSKRWPYNSGLSVPLIVYVPPKFRSLAPKAYQTGGKSDRLVGFIDLAPTLLSLAGIKPPEHMQGHAFMGQHETAEQPFGFGFRGRMDERYDMVRVVRDKRYIYIRNYMPHKIYGQYIDYMFQTPTTRVWKEMFDAGKLTEAQQRFWQRKPAEELYDLKNDPDEVNNLVGSTEHAAVLKRLRGAQEAKAIEIRDVGFLPESEIHSRSRDSSPYEYGHGDDYPITDLVKIAGHASSLRTNDTPQLIEGLNSKYSAIRYWSALGLLMRGKAGFDAAKDELATALNDESSNVRILAAQQMVRFGDAGQAKRARSLLLESSNVEKRGIFESMLALNAIDELDQAAKPIAKQLQALPKQAPSVPRRMRAYIPNLLKKTLRDLKND